MKHVSFSSLAAVLATAAFSLGLVAVQYGALACAVLPCLFLLVIAAKDYAPKARYPRSYQLTLGMDSMAHSHQSLRLAA